MDFVCNVDHKHLEKLGYVSLNAHQDVGAAIVECLKHLVAQATWPGLEAELLDELADSKGIQFKFEIENKDCRIAIRLLKE